MQGYLGEAGPDSREGPKQTERKGQAKEIVSKRRQELQGHRGTLTASVRGLCRGHLY